MYWIWLFSQDTEEYEEEKFHIKSGCSFDEDFFKDIEEEMVTKVPYDINDNRKYLLHSGSQGNHIGTSSTIMNTFSNLQHQ